MVVEKDSNGSGSSRGGGRRGSGDAGSPGVASPPAPAVIPPAANSSSSGVSHIRYAHAHESAVEEEDDESEEKSGLLRRKHGADANSSSAAADAVAVGVGSPDGSAAEPAVPLSEEEAERKRQADEDLVYQFIWREMRYDRSFYMILAISGIIEGSQSMSSLALQYLLKDDLNVTPSAQSILFGIVSIPWVIKPVWGFLSDGFPIFGYHRRSYLFIGGMFACVCWSTLALQTNLSWLKIMINMVCVEIGHAMLSTVTKALLVEHCEQREQKYVSFLQTYYHVFLYASSLCFAFVGGWALTHGVDKSTIFGITAITPGLGALVALFVVERPPAGLSIRQQCVKLWEVVRYPQPNQPYALWRPMLFMVLFSMGPNSGTAMFYFFTERLGFNPQFISYMNMISTLFALIGVVLYQKYFSDVPHRTILCYGMLLTVSFAMLPILVVTRVNIQMNIPDQIFMLSDKAITAAVSRIGHIPVLIMGAQLCPPGIEGTLYALMMSMLNFGAMLAEHNTALLMFIMKVKKGSYDNLPYLIAICCVCALLPLLLLNKLLPFGGQKPTAEATEAAAAIPHTRVIDEHDTARDPLHDGADSAAQA